MPRVLLCHQPTDGGVGRHVRDLANGLGRRGWEVLLCGPEPLADTGQAVHLPLELGRAVSPRRDGAAVLGLARIIGETRPDMVHAHSSKAGAVARLGRALHPRTPVLYTPHGYAFAGYFSHPAERTLYRAVERGLAPLASRVVSVCEAEAQLARSVGAPARVRVVHNGVEPAPPGATDPRLAALRASGPVLGALTLLRPGKGLETLLAALPRVLSVHPSAQLTIFGEGPDLQSLRGLAAQAGVSAAVHFMGPSDRPLEALRGMDVFVHPSWAESFPYVVLEAMSLGRPIVASDVGGIGEALADGSSGLLVPSRDAEALSLALIAMLDDRDRRAAMGAAARRRAEEQFSLQAMVDRLVRVYDELMVPLRIPSDAAASATPGGAEGPAST